MLKTAVVATLTAFYLLLLVRCSAIFSSRYNLLRTIARHSQWQAGSARQQPKTHCGADKHRADKAQQGYSSFLGGD